MELTEDEIVQNYAKHCGPCRGNTLLPHEYEIICNACVYNVTKQKNKLSKNRRKQTHFIKRLKYVERKFFYLYRSILNV